ncbi:hypothetical protein FRC08_013919 [Ceratobasidium sp. 394]|nr:hypothetical protein FRC08_013919 [Ceratobasidium sp. 394]
MNLRDRFAQHQKRRPQYMTTLADQEPDHPDCPMPVDGEPEHSELGLPSSFRQESIQTAGLVSLASLERDLRCAMCDDALDSLRRLLGVRAYALKYKDQHIRGEAATTRAQASLRAHSAKISKARWRYKNSRAALIRLGADATVLLRYQEITDPDLKSLKSYIEDTSRGVGQGYTSIPWIWMNHSDLNVDEWQINALRTEWFRSRERYKRWEEQLVLLKREMVMTVRTFRKREETWDWKAQVRCPTVGMHVYALKQSRFHGELARRALLAFQLNIQDDVVSLRWAEDWFRNHVNDFGHQKSS